MNKLYYILIIATAILIIIYPLLPSKSTKLTVLSFNMWNGGQNRNITAQQYADFIKNSNVDISCLQETSTWVGDESSGIILENLAPVIARILGWNVYIQRTTHTYSTAILSKYNHTYIHFFESNYNGTIETDIIAVEFEIYTNAFLSQSRKKVLVINDHLTDDPYQPFELLNLTGKTPDEIKVIVDEQMESAYNNRSKIFFQKVNQVLLTRKWEDRNMPVFVSADYNEPSHLDWTDRAFDHGDCPCVCDWPTSRGIYNFGFRDSFRTLYPDEVKNKVNSWSVAKEDKGQRFDRIDIVYHMNVEEVNSAKYIDTGFSDHMALLTSFKLAPQM